MSVYVGDPQACYDAGKALATARPVLSMCPYQLSAIVQDSEFPEAFRDGFWTQIARMSGE